MELTYARHPRDGEDPAASKVRQRLKVAGFLRSQERRSLRKRHSGQVEMGGFDGLLFRVRPASFKRRRDDYEFSDAGNEISKPDSSRALDVIGLAK